MTRTPILAAAGMLALAGPARTQGIIGPEAGACTHGSGPAIQVNIVGLKDRKGELKLELYPANEDDFLKDDRDLIHEGKLFRRVRTPTPAGGPVSMCMRVPVPGRYALLVTHNRDGKNKFSFWSDGAGFPSDQKIGRSRPSVTQAEITVGQGITVTSVRVQYLRGLGGFGPIRER